jgi:twitching motility protein PilT
MLAVRAGASDVHLKVGLPPIFRIHGDLRPVTEFPLVSQEALGLSAWDIMNVLQRERFKTTNDVDLAWTILGVGRFRVNVFRQQGKIGMVLRTIPAQVKTLEDLNLPPVLKRLALERRGLLLVTGATGSGKSTTLAAMIEEVNRNLPHHIMTIEDPVEFLFQDKKALINQREVGVDSITFHQALRAALRQDPDVILVGEMRDKETVDIALSAAETGHLVLGTLHTIDAVESINRLLGFYEPHAQQQIRLRLGSSLRAVVSQRLVPAVGGGRAVAVEIMLNTAPIYDCIVDAKRIREIRDLIRMGRAQYQTQLFDQHLYDLVHANRVKQEDALKHANNPDELGLRFAGVSDEE